MSQQLTKWYNTEKAARYAGQYHLADTIHELISAIIHERHDAYVRESHVMRLPSGPIMFPDGWVE